MVSYLKINDAFFEKNINYEVSIWIMNPIEHRYSPHSAQTVKYSAQTRKHSAQAEVDSAQTANYSAHDQLLMRRIL